MKERSTIVDIVLPAFDASMEEGRVVSWHVAVGDKVEARQLIAEIETAKATAELEAPAAGVIESIDIPEGSEPVSVGTTLARLAMPQTAAPAADPPGRRPVEESARAALSSEAPHPDRAQGPPLASTGTTPAAPDPGVRRILASPRARRMAHESGRRLDEISGSGPDGRILGRDLQPTGSGPQPEEPRSGCPRHPEVSPAPPTSPRLDALGFDPGSYRLEPLSGMRRTIARRMTGSVNEAPHFSLAIDVELDGLMEHRQRLNAAARTGDQRLSINDFVVWGAAVALKEVPAANVSYTEEGIARHEHASIAVAIAVEGGLVAPVVREAEDRSVQEIAAQIRRLVEKARARKLDRTDLDGGTFTVSNLGMYGIRSFNSVLTPPQACVLSVGAAERRPVFRGSDVTGVTVATVTLTCDHRVVDGVIGAELLSAFRRCLERVGSHAAS